MKTRNGMIDIQEMIDAMKCCGNCDNYMEDHGEHICFANDDLYSNEFSHNSEHCNKWVLMTKKRKYAEWETVKVPEDYAGKSMDIVRTQLDEIGRKMELNNENV